MTYGNYRGTYSPASTMALAKSGGDAAPAGWENVIAAQNGAKNFAPYATADGYNYPVTPATSDPADRLPELAREKLLRLREARTAAHDLLVPMMDRQREALRDKQKCDVALSRLQRDYKANHHFTTDDKFGAEKTAAHEAFLAEIGRAKAKADRASEVFARVSQIQGERAAIDTALGSLLDLNIERWLNAIPPSARIVPVEAKAAKLKKGESHIEAVDRLRTERAKLLADLSDLKARPLTAAMAKAKAKAQIETLAAAGKPSVHSLLDHGDEVRLKTVSATNYNHTAKVSVFDAAGFIAWLHKDALIAALNREIDAIDTGAGISDEQRAQKEFEIHSILLAMDHEEEGLIVDAEITGTAIERRPDASPMAVLGVTV